AAQGTIEQRLVGRVVQQFPIRRIDALDEQVRVETGLRHKGQYFAACRIKRDQRTTPIAEHLFRDLLQPDVEREREIVAAHRRRARQGPYCTSCRVDLDFLDAGGAVQFAFV